MTEEVVVTGFGVHTAFGRGAQAVRDGVFAGVPAFAAATRFDPTPYRTPMTAAAPGEPVLREVLHDCAHDAVTMAGLNRGAQAAVLVGSAGDWTAVTRFWREREETGLADSVPAHLAQGLADRLGLHGRRLAFTNACVASASALIHGWRLVSSGWAPAAVCAGAYLVEEENHAKFDSGRALAKDGAVRPFSAGRSGLLLGDGVAVLVLESARTARERGARVLARFTSWGIASDAYHVAKPHPEGRGMAAAARQALNRAGLSTVDYVNAHGTGTPLNDSAETNGLRSVLGPSTVVSSTKGTTGHMLEASGAVEFVISLLALLDGVVPPTANYFAPDPACDLDYVTEGPRKADLRQVLSLNAAFGGMNTAIVLEHA
ncbi:beta-ketoacyl-[acyl-carrier-protein] synthase family protein [Kutzneria albida]|uniref:Secondary metabolite synthesis protein n=1 Tax=Kutzneria albida DSM 43870 TaxID=1449976 RepID=W5W369_9PSEU|nr:beta-ketoacyl-[acyl-carrier-protein] synthase family protein [Kutzneria albida]AHH95623.1 secondary metabolite synthesis protein [Kutzneria albida DSM 43870]